MPNLTPQTAPASAQDTFLRVKAAKVSQLLDLVGELSLVAAGVIRHPDLKHLELEGFEIAGHTLELLMRELQDLATSLRLVPLDGVFKRMQRQVRDLAQQTGKQIELIQIGAETEIDKALVDQLHDPLMHLVRNAIDHGLELPEERRAAGKADTGQITLSATQQGREVSITVADDGRGLNRDKILDRAKKQGLVGAHETPNEATIWGFIFHSGFSTAETVSNLSGRGVGMDVVRTAVEALRGRISIDSQAGSGSQITLHIPLTLAFLDSMVIRLNKCLYTIPIDSVQEVIKPQPDQITYPSANHNEAVVQVRGKFIPICRLEHFYQSEVEAGPLEDTVIVIVQTSSGELGLPVDEIVGQEQATMKSLEGALSHIRAGAGCVLLASGDVAVALDCERLAQELTGQGLS